MQIARRSTSCESLRSVPKTRRFGEPPDAANSPAGCKFCTRCPIAIARCREEEPALEEIETGHFVRCHLCEAAEDPDPVVPGQTEAGDQHV